MDSDPGSDDVLVPLYDKSLREGRGDRADPAKWTRAKSENSAKFCDFCLYFFLNCVFFRIAFQRKIIIVEVIDSIFSSKWLNNDIECIIK